MTRFRWGMAVVGAMALTLAACSSGSDELDMSRAKSKIDELATKVYGGESKVGAVKCPDSIPLEKAQSFTCTVAIDGAPLRIRLKQTDAKGNVHIEQADAVIYTAKLVDFVTTYAGEHDRPGTTVDCGKAPVIMGPPGEVLTCDVTFSDGTAGVAKVVINDTDGKVGLTSIKPTS
jgi:hypothetical protein